MCFHFLYLGHLRGDTPLICRIWGYGPTKAQKQHNVHSARDTRWRTLMKLGLHWNFVKNIFMLNLPTKNKPTSPPSAIFRPFNWGGSPVWKKIGILSNVETWSKCALNWGVVIRWGVGLFLSVVTQFVIRLMNLMDTLWFDTISSHPIIDKILSFWGLMKHNSVFL